ncbi:MAG: hypothetical protein HGA36_04935 [Candidatus Moranbacteria bacterium]|nr:hypothetical protein [Candidatus Moranbacteria bacterium]
MRKRNIGIILAFVAVGIIGIVFWGMKQPEQLQLASASSQSASEQADVVLYFGQECSHCKVVEKFIKDNQIEQKVIFTKKEVWHNTANNSDLQDKAKECALNPDKVGVPFLFARGKCYVGETEVQAFFKKEAGI